MYTLPNIVLGEIAIRHKWYGEQLCTVSETPNLELIASIINSMVSANKADAIMYINLDATPTSFGGTVALFEKEPSADNKVQASYLHQILTSHG